MLARHIGKPIEEIARDIRRPKYFSPSEAVDYGIIDKVNNHHSRPEETTQSDLTTTACSTGDIQRENPGRWRCRVRTQKIKFDIVFFFHK